MKKPDFVSQHFMPRECEIIFGFLLMIIGVWLIWLAYDARGKKLMWPISGLMPT